MIRNGGLTSMSLTVWRAIMSSSTGFLPVVVRQSWISAPTASASPAQPAAMMRVRVRRTTFSRNARNPSSGGSIHSSAGALLLIEFLLQLPDCGVPARRHGAGRNAEQVADLGLLHVGKFGRQ